jgi:hypothetical protein
MPFEPRPLESHIEWRAADVADPAQWTITLTAEDQQELEDALRNAQTVSDDILDVGKAEFPLQGLAVKLAEVEHELINGRGFVRLAGLESTRYTDDELTLIYWGIGAHLGDPWPQNRHGHMLGDVTDQGKRADDPDVRGNEIGQAGLDYHTDGSDLVGLMCLRAAKSGGLSCVANAVGIYNELVRTRPDLAAALFERLPWDFRGEQPEGGRRYYLHEVFTEHGGRLFVRFIPQYIKASQRHPEAPRLTQLQIEALDTVSAMARDPQFNVYMELPPGSMQFINNYHVLHGRTPYEDDVAAGYKRHLKRLWLATRTLQDRPPNFKNGALAHWAKNRSISRIAPVERVEAS